MILDLGRCPGSNGVTDPTACDDDDDDAGITSICCLIREEAPVFEQRGKAWPFFLFWLDLPDVASDSESEGSNRSPQSISILLSCKSRTASSIWRLASLASSSVIVELACTNFSSAFQQQSHLAEAFSSANLTLSVRLSWQLLYHSTFLLDSEDALSSIWQTTFSHAV